MMKRFLSTLRRDIKATSSSSNNSNISSSATTFKSEVHAQSATNIQRQQWLKKRNDMLSSSSNTTSKVMDSNGFVNNSVVKKTGIERYEIQPVKSSADIYRQMRANGQLGQLNSGINQANITSSSSPSIWSSTVGLLTILGAVFAWNMTQSTTLLDTTDIAIALDATNESCAQALSTDNVDPNKLPLWLQRPRSY